MAAAERLNGLTSRQAFARERLLREGRAPGVYRSTPLLSSSGSEIEVYHDFDLLVRDPINARDMVELLSGEIESIRAAHKVDLLGFIDKTGNTVGAIMFAAALSIETGIPHIEIRLWKHLPSERIKLPSTDDKRPISNKLRGSSVLIITDHSTRGTEVFDAIDTVEDLGGNVNDVIVHSVHKAQFSESMDSFKERGVEIHHFVEIPDDFEREGIQRLKVYS